MGILERKLREKEAKRSAILASAKDLIIGKGFQNVSLQDVADRLEISKAALYLTFKSKDAMVLEVLKEAAHEFHHFLEERTKGCETGLDAIKAMARAYFEFYRDNQANFLLFGIWEYFAPAAPFCIPEAGAEEIRHFKVLISSLISRGITDGSLDPALDPDQTSTAVIFLANSFVTKVSKIPKDQRSPEFVMPPMKAAFELILRSLAHPDTDRSSLAIDIGTIAKEHS